MLSRGTRLVLFSEALLLVPLARLAVWVLPFSWLARTLGQPDWQSGPVTPAELAVVKQAARAVDWIARACRLRSSCLVRASALQWILRQRGIASTVHLGTRRDEQQAWRFHAWVTVAGQIVGRPEMVPWRTVKTFSWAGAPVAGAATPAEGNA